MKELTTQQYKILEFIKSEICDKGYPPTVREICEAVGLKSSSTVHGHLISLEKKGYIKRDPSIPRAIEIVDDSINIDVSKKEVYHVPIIGNVTAGSPILAVENIEETYPIPIDFLDSDSQYFILKIKGNSMIKAGIHDGDCVLVKQQPTAENGDIVVALLGYSATVKRFFKEDNHIILHPENPAMEDIIVLDVKILGIVKGVFRKL